MYIPGLFRTGSSPSRTLMKSKTPSINQAKKMKKNKKEMWFFQDYKEICTDIYQRPNLPVKPEKAFVHLFIIDVVST